MNRKADDHRDIGKDSEGARGGGGLTSPGIMRAFISFRNPAYRIYYISVVCQWFSMNMEMVARSLLMYRITGSGAILGMMALANAVPTILLSLVGGVIADRFQKKHVMFVGQAGTMVVSLGTAIALAVGYLGPEHPGSWWVLIACGVLQGALGGLIMPSRQALIPEIVSEEQVMNAVSLGTLGMNALRLIAPAAAGFIIDAFDFVVVYYISAGMYLIATISVVFLPRIPVKPASGSSATADILEGVQYIRQHTAILFVVLFTFAGMICSMPFGQLLPMFTEDILKVGATGMGLLMSVSGVGAIIGSLVLAYLPGRKQGLIFLLSGLIVGLAQAGFSFSRWWHLSLMITPFVGLGLAGHQTMSMSLIQYYTDANYRGRVMGFLLMGQGLASLGTFFAGILTGAIGVQWSVGGMAMVLALISVLMWTLTPRLRKLD